MKKFPRQLRSLAKFFLTADSTLLPWKSRRLLVGSVISAVVLAATSVKGATLTVFNGNDSGPGSLRQTIFDAVSGDTISFASGIDQIRLTSDKLLINKNLTIDGPITVQASAGNRFRVFHIAPASVTATLSRLTISGGRSLSNEHGGGILNTGTLIINNSTIADNTTDFDGTSNGGGIANTGALTITNSTISRNAIFFRTNVSGAGIANFNGGTLTITNKYSLR